MFERWKLRRATESVDDVSRDCARKYREYSRTKVWAYHAATKGDFSGMKRFHAAAEGQRGLLKATGAMFENLEVRSVSPNLDAHLRYALHLLAATEQELEKQRDIAAKSPVDCEALRSSLQNERRCLQDLKRALGLSSACVYRSMNEQLSSVHPPGEQVQEGAQITSVARTFAKNLGIVIGAWAAIGVLTMLITYDEALSLQLNLQRLMNAPYIIVGAIAIYAASMKSLNETYWRNVKNIS